MRESGSSELVLEASSADIAGTNVGQDRRRMGKLSFGGQLCLRRAGEKEAFLLALICAVDMYTTLWWVAHGEAHEANPLLAWTFQHHPVWFVVVKCVSCLPGIFLLTTLAQRRRQLTVWLLRLAVVVYLSIYLWGIQ